ncbi:unannotated protein [freshwater metagenome]|uniref:Unannotated protein n=1 Tax=freshwater metagenome TaxID=449393 RepID=A0A6J7ARJ6_9ZZZZ
MGTAITESTNTGTQIGASGVTNKVAKQVTALTRSAIRAAFAGPMRALTGPESRPPTTANPCGTTSNSAMKTIGTL